MTRRRGHRWLLAVVASWLAVDLMLLIASAPRPAATVIPTDPPSRLAETPAGTESGPSSGNLSQPTTASKLAEILLNLGAQVSDFEDGTEYILTGRGIVVSLWLGDTPAVGHPDSLNVQLVLP